MYACVKKCKVAHGCTATVLKSVSKGARRRACAEEGTMAKRLLVLSVALIGFGEAGLPMGDTPGVPAADLIAARQASLDMSVITFRSMGDAMKAGGEAKSQGFPAAVLAKWAKVLPQMFPAGTGKGETPADTQALPAIWKDRAGFDKAADNYASVTARLVSLATSNDTAAFTKQLEEVNQACISCHSRYKEAGANPHGK
jgi:cytochrome c556